MQKNKNVGSSSSWAGCPSERRGKRQRETSASHTHSPPVGGRTLLLTLSYGWGSRNSGNPPALPNTQQEAGAADSFCALASQCQPPVATPSTEEGGPGGHPGALGGVHRVQEGVSVAPA